MSFSWPNGVRAALSLTFDDARPSQADRGLGIFDKHGVKATFYVSPKSVDPRLDAWKAAAEAGHEIGNHTVSHPCSGNFPWSRDNALEEYTLDRMAGELDRAHAHIRDAVGVEPQSFAYPCAQKFVGRGTGQESYVPLVAERYAVGRDAFNEIHNDPAFCDLAVVASYDSDRASYEQIVEKIERAIEAGAWVLFTGHEIGDDARQTTLAGVLDRVCRFARENEERLWTDTVSAIGTHVRDAR